MNHLFSYYILLLVEKRWSSLLCLIIFGPSLTPDSAWASPPNLTFDLEHRIACKRIHDEPGVLIGPGEQLMQVRIPVSTLLQAGSASPLTELLIRFESPDPTIQVVDYHPRTTLGTEVVGNIGMETRRDHTAGIDLSLSGQPSGIRGSTTANLGSKHGQYVKWETLPPLELLSASGTVARGSGAYFKLRSSRRHSLEGKHDFTLLLRVPDAWQSGVLHVECVGKTSHQSTFSPATTLANCGREQFVVALHAADNAAAQQHAKRFTQAEHRLRRVATTYHEAVRERAYPYPGYRVAVFFQATEPRIPKHWLEQVLFHVPGPRAGQPEIPFRNGSSLPEPIQQAISHYLATKRQLLVANGVRPLTRSPGSNLQIAPAH